MPAVICDTSPLQYLHQAELLRLLPALFGVVVVPPAVVSELNEGKRRGVHLPESSALPWVTVRSVRDPMLVPPHTNLGDGEKEVIALARESEDPLLVLDDRGARRYAASIGLAVTGTLGILVLAKERHLIDSIRPVLNRLQALGFHLGVNTRAATLRLAGEV